MTSHGRPGIIHSRFFIAFPAQSDAEEQAADSRFRWYLVPAIADVVILSAVVFWRAGCGLGLGARLGGPAHALPTIHRQIASAVLRTLPRRQVRNWHQLPAYRCVDPALELLIQRVISRQQMCHSYRQRIQRHRDPATVVAGASRLAESTRFGALRARSWRRATSACHGSTSRAASFANALPLS